jgi:hypothetical protein
MPCLMPTIERTFVDVARPTHRHVFEIACSRDPRFSRVDQEDFWYEMPKRDVQHSAVFPVMYVIVDVGPMTPM